MKRNKITIIELVIIISVIVVVVRIWTYKNTHNNIFPTPVSNKNNSSVITRSYNPNGYKCPKCGSSEITEGMTNDGGITPNYCFCNNCRYGWESNPLSKEQREEIRRMVQ
jgi:hypothetical protein